MWRDEARRLGTSALYEGATVVARWPRVAVPVARWRAHGIPVDDRTDVVIEGYPCSGNSFTVAAFRLAQEGDRVEIAHHTHAPGNVIAAIRRALPVLVLVREPDEAVRDFVMTRAWLSFSAGLRGYVRFYQPLLRYRAGFVVGRFSEVRADLGPVIDRLNARFGTSFRPFHHTEANLERAEAAVAQTFATRSGPGLPAVGRAVGPGSPGDSASGRPDRDLGTPPPALAGRARRVFQTLTAEAR